MLQSTMNNPLLIKVFILINLDELTMELFEKLKDFKYLAKNKSGEDLITARIQ